MRSFHLLMAAVVVEGRALPLCWASSKEKVQGRCQNALAEAMLLRIAAALPAGIRVVILADRGFGRAEMIRTCRRLNLEYLIRVRGDVQIHVEGSRHYRGPLKHYAIRRGQCHSYREVLYRGEKPVRTKLILRWARGLAGDRDVPWYLATSLPVGRGRTRSLSQLYRLRFDIEELFRDARNEHRGWSLAKARVKRADRLDRLILIAALAYVLLAAVGLWARRHLDPRLQCTNRRRRELSAFSIARTMLERIDRALDELIDLLLLSLANPGETWG